MGRDRTSYRLESAAVSAVAAAGAETERAPFAADINYLSLGEDVSRTLSHTRIPFRMLSHKPESSW